MRNAFANLKEKILSPLGCIVLCVLISLLTALATYSMTTHYYNAQSSLYYSLDERKNDEKIISVIDDADRYVYFAIYYFTKENIADALIRAQKRGLVVWGIVDRESSVGANKIIVEKLREAGVAVETQKHEDGIMHIKAVVTDKAYASGSYNWTGSATTINDEVLEVSENSHMRAKYLSLLKRLLLENE